MTFTNFISTIFAFCIIIILGPEYVNVAEDDSTQKQKSWSKKWGELLEDTLYVYPNRKPNTQLQNKYKIKGCEIHPAVKETGRILAFKIVNNDKVVIILEVVCLFFSNKIGISPQNSR